MEARAARRRGIGGRLERALIASAAAHGCEIAVIEAALVPWASVSFTGARHQLVFVAPETPALRPWLAALPELDLPLSGHLVADLEVEAEETQGTALHITLAVLTVEEC